MAQFYRTERRNLGRSRLIYVTSLVVIVFLLDLVAGGRLRAAIRTSASAVYVSLNHVGVVVHLSGIFSTRSSLAHQNAVLEVELRSYRSKDAAYASMLQENARLRALTGLAAKKKGVAASVVSDPSASPYGTFIIDGGTEQSISRGDIVFTSDGFAIGIVSDPGPSTSLVTEIFAPDASIEGIVGDTSIVLRGGGGGNARAQAPRDARVGVGDVVRVPRVDAPVGVIEKVQSESTSAYKELYMRIPANLSTLSFVYVARK